ncbi:hypothetical protein [Stappia sp.]|uniref:hypothetical protein n=1 Tax=Stappia sp. TaxID=1870903 RepID=UPI0032D95A3B
MNMRVDFPAPDACTGGEAEHLVVEGLRRWLAGYQTGNISCWEDAWSLYAGRLGVARARVAVSGLSAYARAINGWAKCGFCLMPHDCPRRCAHEAMAVEALAAWQRGNREAATGIVEELVVSPGLPSTLEATAFFADSLRRVDLRLVSAALPPGARQIPRTHAPSLTRH